MENCCKNKSKFNASTNRWCIDPQPNALPTGGGAFVAALMDGARFSEALAAAGAGFDLTEMLGILLTGAAITKIDDEG